MPRAGDDELNALIAEWTAAGTTVDAYVLPDSPNGRGADALGLRPEGNGMDARAMLEAARDGKLGVLSILGANPVLRFPDRALVEEALRATPFVVVTDLFLTETAEFADLVLPVCSAFEKSGTTTDLAGDVLPVTGSVVAPDGVIADGDAFVMLADELHVALPMPDEMEKTIVRLVKTAPARQLASPAPAAANADAGLRVVAETTIFTGGGTLAFDSRIAELRTVPRATLHPETALRLGVADGDLVTVSAPNGGTLRELVAVIDERVPDGAVALVDGLPLAPLNALGGAPVVTLEKALVTA
jgi:anaerobic selenocysteine-containing dehydrogenase